MFDMIAHQQLIQSLNESIVSLLKHHNLPRDDDNIEESLTKLPEPRKQHAILLYRMMNYVKQDFPGDDIANKMLNGAALFIYSIIKFYHYSDLHNSLENCLQLGKPGKKNSPDNVETYMLYASLKNVLKETLFNSGSPAAGVIDGGIFKDTEKKSMSELLLQLSGEIESLETEITRDIVNKFQSNLDAKKIAADKLAAEKQPKAPFSWGLSGLWSGSAPVETSKTSEPGSTEILEDKSDVDHAIKNSADFGA